jgi:hypothetical protein
METNPLNSVNDESKALNRILNISGEGIEFIDNLIKLGYCTEKDIVKLFIRTSTTIHVLRVKLIKGRFDTNCCSIVENNGNILVRIPSLDKKSLINVSGQLRV